MSGAHTPRSRDEGGPRGEPATTAAAAAEGQAPAGYPTPHQVLARLGLRPLKRLGQHFLTDVHIARRIAAACELTATTPVLEVGAGTGALTQHLIAPGRRVVAVEIDKLLAPVLAENLDGPSGLEVIQADVRTLDLAALARERTPDERWVFASNVPYLLTTDLVTQILDAGPIFERAILLVQREYAARLAAQPGTETYGALTVYVRQLAVVEHLFAVSRGCFHPIPEVESSVIRLIPRLRPAVAVRSQETMRDVVRAAFGMRRKMLGNTVAKIAAARDAALTGGELCRRAGIDAQRRGETLDLADFAALADALEDVAPRPVVPAPDPAARPRMSRGDA